MLAAVERELADEPFIVVGVHSPKFPTEGDAEMVRHAIRRHGVTHPVVVDTGHRIWNEYGIRAWPTLVLVGGDGVIVGAASGEPDAGSLLTTVRSVLDAQRTGLDDTPLPLAPEPAVAGALAYPGGIAVGGDRVYVADTGHHQIVECDTSGRELRRFGTAHPGLSDGVHARFRSPHGLTVDGTRLLVADTGNHAVRAVDLASGETQTIAGTGEKATTFGSRQPARSAALRSPWDVAVAADGRVVIAMAGNHQLWELDERDVAVVDVLAGNGVEARIDGAAADAAFAQPSGLAVGPDGTCFVADSETSAIRAVAFSDAGITVETVAGGNLFAFGDQDGRGDEVRFQHPMGVASTGDGRVLVADTLNHKVKLLTPATGDVQSLFGNGTAFDAALASLEHRVGLPGDLRAAAAALREPESVAWLDGRVLVADTGNHRVVAADPDSGRGVVWLGGGS